MSTQVPKSGGRRDACRYVDPVEVSQLFSGISLGAEGEALLGGECSTDAVEIGEGGGVCSLEDLFMVRTSGYHHQIICQRPRYGLESSDMVGPWG